MSAEEDQMAAPDTPGEPAPQVDDAEQQTAQSGSLSALIMEQAKNEGAEIGDPKGEAPPSIPKEPQVEDTPPPSTEDAPVTEPTAEEPQETQEEPAKKEKIMVPLREVMEERAKKERAKIRADEAEKLRFAAEERARQLEQQVVALQGPQPTKNDPVVDVQDIPRLDALQKQYKRFLRETEEAVPDEDDGLYKGVLIGINTDGTPKRADLNEKQFKDLRIEARAAIDDHIPERRTLLQQRLVEDEKVVADYPEILKDAELQQTFAYFGNEILSGRAAKSPFLSRYLVIAAKAFLEEQKQNGSKTPVKDDNSKQILKAVQQPVAPTPTRTRTVPVRRGADEASAVKKLVETGSPEAAEEVIMARLARRGASAETLEPTGE